MLLLCCNQLTKYIQLLLCMSNSKYPFMGKNLERTYNWRMSSSSARNPIYKGFQEMSSCHLLVALGRGIARHSERWRKYTADSALLCWLLFDKCFRWPLILHPHLSRQRIKWIFFIWCEMDRWGFRDNEVLWWMIFWKAGEKRKWWSHLWEDSMGMMYFFCLFYVFNA